MTQTLTRESSAGEATDAIRPAARARRLRATHGAVVASLVTSTAFIFRSRFTLDGKVAFSLFDDAMISLTYARNLARGSGLVWNQGGDRVEGYTNFLWTLGMSGIHLVGVPDHLTSLVVMVAGALLLAATVVVTARIARHAHPDPVVAAIAAWMVALSPPLIFWTLRGMEVGFLAAVLAGSVLLADRVDHHSRPRHLFALGVLLAAGVLTRTDFAILALVVGLFATWWSDPARRARVAAATLGVVVVTALAHTVFRIAYYGAAMPNTYTLKIEGIPLTDRLDRGLTVVGDIVAIELLVPLVIIALGFLVARTRPSRLEQLAGTLVVASFAYVAWTGGDAWEWMTMPNRYVAPVIPELALLVGVAAVKLVGAARPATTRTLGAVGVAVVLLMFAVAVPAADGGRQLASGTFLRIASITALAGVGALAVLLVAPRAPRRHLAAAIGAIAVLSLLAMPAAQWVRINAPYLDADQHNARWGARIASLTTPDAVVAVVSAGAITYFADRTSVDLLGKSDVTIASEAPKPVPFVPGHVKYDYAWSFGKLHPDLVTAYYADTRLARAALREFGYEQVRGRVWAKSGSSAVDVDALRRSLAVEPAEIVPASSR